MPTPSTLPQHGEPTADDLAGMAWYNSQTEDTLRFWHTLAGSAAPVDAWIAYRDTAGNDCPPPPAAQTAASLQAPAAGQGGGSSCTPLRRSGESRCPVFVQEGEGEGTHSYLWHQVLLTDPIGQWLCVGGRHGCAWSIKRSDKASMDRVQRRRA